MTDHELERRLAAIRAEAARRCGLVRYPAELIRTGDLLREPWLKSEDRRKLRERQALLLARLERIP